jgi:hypothetical protein
MDEQTFTLGEHNALLKRLEQGQDAIFKRLGTIEQTLAEQRGARRAGAAFWGGISGLSGALIALITKAWLASHA